MGLWRTKRKDNVDPKKVENNATESLAEAKKALQKLKKDKPEVDSIAGTLRAIRERNHFQELWKDALRGM